MDRVTLLLEVFVTAIDFHFHLNQNELWGIMFSVQQKYFYLFEILPNVLPTIKNKDF